MKKIISIILLFYGLGCYAQSFFVPEDLSYDFRISKEDVGVKGNVKKVSQSYTNTRTSPPNKIGIRLYGDYNFDSNIYEEGRDVYYDKNYRTPIFATFYDGGFTCEFARSSNFVESIRWTYRQRHGGYIGPEIFFDYHYKYDSDNKIISVITDDEYKKSFFFKYENGLLVEKEVNSFNNDEEVYPTTYKYDAQGRIVEVVTIPTHRGKKNGDPSIRSYSYSAEGDNTIVKSTCSNVKLVMGEAKRNRISKWIYNKNGKLLESEIYVTKKNGKTFRASSGSDNIFTRIKSTYTYNQSGQIIKRDDVYSDNPGFMSGSFSHFKKTTYEYDSHGSLVMEIENYSAGYSNSNIGTVLTSFKYEYDTNGNWIRKKTYINDVLIEITTRDITYWD